MQISVGRSNNPIFGEDFDASAMNLRILPLHRTDAMVSEGFPVARRSFQVGLRAGNQFFAVRTSAKIWSKQLRG